MVLETQGRAGRIIMGRLLPNTDLVKGIEELCVRNGIKHGIISTCIGSLKQAAFIYALPKEGAYYDIEYSKPIIKEGEFEFLNGQGLVAMDEAGKFQMHLHATISNSDMSLNGCHIVEGNIVLATIEVVITELLDLNFQRELHVDSGFYFFNPK